MPKSIDLINARFGRLLVVKKLPSENGKTYWECNCDCGNTKKVKTEQLRDGTAISCGCDAKKADYYFDIINHTKYGMLTILTKADPSPNSNNIRVVSVCDCGNTTTSFLKDLKSGHTKSCGCYGKKQSSTKLTKNEIGNTYGNLNVLRAISKNCNGGIVWECECKCGSIVNVDGNNLRSMKVRSCGCITSKGEEAISDLLSNMGIRFTKQYTFDDCVSDSGRRLKFDFAILSDDNKLKYLIEYDGEQHFRDIPYFSKKETFQSRVKKDNIKTAYCEENGILLYRINYKDNIEESINRIIGG